ncbi:hypothetical protein [Burkholderia sp. WSM2232]|uniref:hypothetical protein n=1 Tax=Burkholderia sp. WSM2232 TaxID=944436 RepID=UPI0012EC44CF|nr:hypothetical protein [Burkholderia sp. WSM2232]
MLMLLGREAENPLLAVIRNPAFWSRWGFTHASDAASVIERADQYQSQLPPVEQQMIDPLVRLISAGQLPVKYLLALHRDPLFRHLLRDVAFNPQSRLDFRWIRDFARHRICWNHLPERTRHYFHQQLIDRGVIAYRTSHYKNAGLFNRFSALVYAATDAIPAVLDDFLIRAGAAHTAFFNPVRQRQSELLFGTADVSGIAITDEDCRLAGVSAASLDPFVNGGRQGSVKTVQDCFAVMQGTPEGLLLLCTVYLRLRPDPEAQRAPHDVRGSDGASSAQRRAFRSVAKGCVVS